MTWPLWLVRRRLAHWRGVVAAQRRALAGFSAAIETSEERYAENRLTIALSKVQTWRGRLPR